MSTADQAIATQIANIQVKAGKTLDELGALLKGSGHTKHGALRTFAQERFGLGFGDANTLAHAIPRSDGASQAQERGLSTDQVLEAIYTEPRAALRPIHDCVMEQVTTLGGLRGRAQEGHVSLRRKKQFAMVGPGTNSRVDVGLNLKGTPGTDRLLEQKPGGMCSHSVRVTSPSEVDAELLGWLRQSYDDAG
jgi:hypothetical protein